MPMAIERSADTIPRRTQRDVANFWFRTLAQGPQRNTVSAGTTKPNRITGVSGLRDTIEHMFDPWRHSSLQLAE